MPRFRCVSEKWSDRPVNRRSLARTRSRNRQETLCALPVRRPDLRISAYATLIAGNLRGRPLASVQDLSAVACDEIMLNANHATGSVQSRTESGRSCSRDTNECSRQMLPRSFRNDLRTCGPSISDRFNDGIERGCDNLALCGCQSCESDADAAASPMSPATCAALVRTRRWFWRCCAHKHRLQSGDSSLLIGNEMKLLTDAFDAH